MTIKLYHCPGARSLRPLWTLEELALDYELEVMSFPPRFLHEGYAEMNPIGTVPFFVDGDVTMTESSGICRYLVDTHGPTPLTLTSKEKDYADFLNWMYRSDATLTFPLTLVLRYSKIDVDVTLEKIVDDYTKWFFSRLRSVERATGEREFLCANRFTIADICVVYALYLADKALNLGANFKPNTKAYYERIMSRPAIARINEHDMPVV